MATSAAFGRMAASIDEAVTFARETGSAQLVVILEGRCVAEAAFDPAPVDVFAVQKGLVSLLAAMVADRGMIDIDDPVNRHLPSGWTALPAADEARLTLRHLATMTTGMDDALGPLGTIGVDWRYNNVAYNYLKRILCERTGETLDGLTAWLTEPLGMASTSWIERSARLPDGRPLTGLLSTASDLARLGQLVLQRGRWRDEPLVPEAWIDEMAAAGSIDNPAWGLLWWNNDASGFRVPMREDRRYEGPIIPSAPTDLIAARGALDNHLGIVPSRDLIVARTARPVERGERPAPFERGFYERLDWS